MRQRDSNERATPRIETLEPRTLCAADLLGVTPASLFEPASAPVNVSASPIPLRTAAARSPYPQVTGAWIGTATTVGKKRRTEIAMRLTRQGNGGATGKFALGPATTWHKVLSTAVLSADRSRSFRVILPGDGFYGSVTATVSRDGNQIVGRWTCNSDGIWKTGTLVLNRQP